MNWQRSAAIGVVATLALVLSTNSLTIASTAEDTARYRPGDRVECDQASIGIWEAGTVMPFLPGDANRNPGSFYRVKLDSKLYGDRYAAGHECRTERIRPIKDSSVRAGGKPQMAERPEAKAPTKETPENTRPSPTPRPAPQLAGSSRSLPGTAWKIDFGRGVTGTVFLFCRSGRWEIVPQRAGTIGAVGKSFAVSGSTLTTVNADDGMVQKWTMTWRGAALELFDGSVTLRLHYNGENRC